MTGADPDVDRDPLYKSEAEIARLVGVGLAKWRANAVVLEKQGLPLPDPMFCDRRYWPAVRAFFDRRHGLIANSPSLQRGKENWDGYFNRGTRPAEAKPGKRRGVVLGRIGDQPTGGELPDQDDTASRTDA